MKLRARWMLAAAFLAVFIGVVVVAIALGPREARVLLVSLGVLAAAAAVQSVTSEPRDLIPALVLALPPVIALAAHGSPTWLIGPLAVLLFVAGELNAMSWEARGPFPMSAAQRRRLVDSGVLALLAFGGVLAVEGVVAGGAAGGRVAVALAAVVLGGMGAVMFRAGAAEGERSPPDAPASPETPSPSPP